MAEQKRYYWLKLRKDFFQSQQIRILEGMPNGKEYAYFLLKLMAESISAEGKLRLTDTIPYSEEMLAALTNTNVDIVRAAVEAFQALGLVQLMDDGTYYMTEVEKMIGSVADNDNAERQRRFKERKRAEALLNVTADNVTALPERYSSVTKSNESIEYRDKSKEIRDKKDIYGAERTAIITYLNQELGTKYRSDSKAIREMINGRLSEGYTVDDFKTVISNMAAEWSGDEKMSRYLRPSTLFAPTHFPEYLNRKPKAKKQSYFGDDDDFDLDFLTR